MQLFFTPPHIMAVVPPPGSGSQPNASGVSRSAQCPLEKQKRLACKTQTASPTSPESEHQLSFRLVIWFSSSNSPGIREEDNLLGGLSHLVVWAVLQEEKGCKRL